MMPPRSLRFQSRNIISFVTALSLCLGPIASVQAAAAPVTLFQWEDYTDAPFLAEYKKQYKDGVNVALFADEDEAFAKMRAGYKPDVMGPCYYEYPRWKEAGLLAPIDTRKLKNWNKIPQSLRAMPGIKAGEHSVWFVPHYWGNTSVTFRTDLAPEYAKNPSWAILFDPKYRGRIAVMDGVDDTVPLVARAIGIDAYSMTPEQWTKVQAKLREVIKQARFVSSDDTALAQGLASGEIVAAISWRVTYTNLKKEGVKVAYMKPKGGIFTYVCGLVMHKQRKDEAKALALIDSSLSDAAAIYAIEHIGDEPANVVALKHVPDATFEKLGMTRDVDVFLKSGIFQQRLKNKEKIIAAWSEIRAGL